MPVMLARLVVAVVSSHDPPHPLDPPQHPCRRDRRLVAARLLGGVSERHGQNTPQADTHYFRPER